MGTMLWNSHLTHRLFKSFCIFAITQFIHTTMRTNHVIPEFEKIKLLDEDIIMGSEVPASMDKKNNN